MELSRISKRTLDDFMIRKTPAQKENFRAWLTESLTALGYAPKVEKSKSIFACNNVTAGNADNADVLLTAHYDTCPVLPFPNLCVPEKPLLSALRRILMCLIFAGLAAVTAFTAHSLFKKGNMAGGVIIIIALAALIGFSVFWMMAGKANMHTVNDNSSGVITLLEIAQTLPNEIRDRVCLVFFDNEEKGLFGSRAFAKEHRKVKKNTLVLNFDCVSDGDYIKLFPCEKLRKDTAAYNEILDALRESFKNSGKKRCEVYDGKSSYPSDQLSFCRGIGICALKKGRIGYYLDKIHTKRDTVMDAENIFILRDNTLNYLEKRFSAPRKGENADA